MIQHRLDRRLHVLRGKREVAFNEDQHYLERAWRARTARQVRVHVRRMQPLCLVTPRWTQVRRFLDDLTADLLLGEPSVVARSLSLLPLDGRTPHQAWAWLVQAITEFCMVTLDGPAWQVVSRRGFRHVMRDLFAKAELGERRCLMIHGLEYIHVEALRDLIAVFGDHVRERRGEPRFTLMLCGTIDGDHFEFPGFRKLTLPDYGPDEAVEALVEHVGPRAAPMLEAATALLGGVPAWLDLLAAQPGGLGVRGADDPVLWRALGAVGQELRLTVDQARADDELSQRLDELLERGVSPAAPVDERLERVGLVRRDPAGRTTQLRAPLVQWLLQPA